MSTLANSASTAGAPAPTDPVSPEASPPAPKPPIPVVLTGQAALVTGAKSGHFDLIVFGSWGTQNECIDRII